MSTHKSDRERNLLQTRQDTLSQISAFAHRLAAYSNTTFDARVQAEAMGTLMQIKALMEYALRIAEKIEDLEE